MPSCIEPCVPAAISPLIRPAADSQIVEYVEPAVCWVHHVLGPRLFPSLQDRSRSWLDSQADACTDASGKSPHRRTGK